MNESPRRYRTLVVCRVCNCPTCAREVMVHDGRCDECGGELAIGSTVRTIRQAVAIPAASFSLSDAAAAMGSLDVALAFNLN